MDRAHRELTNDQIELIASVVRLYRGQRVNSLGAREFAALFPDGVYRDVPGFCRVENIDAIARNRWSLNPALYTTDTSQADTRHNIGVTIAEKYERFEEALVENSSLEFDVKTRLSQLFGHPLSAVDRKDWNVRVLGDCLQLLSGGTPRDVPENWGGDIPWVSCKDMKIDHLFDTEDHVTDAGARKGTRLVPSGTILIVVRGMVLAKELPVAWTMRSMTFNQDLKAVVPREGVDGRFLFYWLRSNAARLRDLADEAAHGTKRIQTERILAFPIHLPPPDQQKEIAHILNGLDRLLEPRARSVRALRDALLPHLVDGAIGLPSPG